MKGLFILNPTIPIMIVGLTLPLKADAKVTVVVKVMDLDELINVFISDCEVGRVSNEKGTGVWHSDSFKKRTRNVIIMKVLKLLLLKRVSILKV